MSSILTNPYSRTVINQGERPVSADINQQASDAQDTAMWFAESLLKATSSIGSGQSISMTNSSTGAFLADGFFVDAAVTPGSTVTVRPGLGFLYNPADEPSNIGGVNGVDDVAPLKPMPLSTTQTFNVPAADPLNGRYDLIEAAPYRRLEQQQSRDVINPIAGTVTATLVNKVLAYYLDGQTGNVVSPAASTAGISYKAGTPSGIPALPTVTPGYTPIAYIWVPAGSTTVIAQSNIQDVRPLAFHDGLSRVTGGITVHTTDGVNADSTTGAIQAPPGVRVVAVVPSGTVANGLNVFVTAGSAAAPAILDANYLLKEAVPAVKNLSTVQFGCIGLPADGASYNLGFNYYGQAGSTPTLFSWIAPFAGTLTSLALGFIYQDAPSGPYTIGTPVPNTSSGGGSTVTVRINPGGGIVNPPFPVAAGLTATLAPSATTSVATGSVAFNAGDWIMLEVTGETGATTITNQYLNAILGVEAQIVPATTTYAVNNQTGEVAATSLQAGDAIAIAASTAGVSSLPGPLELYGAPLLGQPVYKVVLPFVNLGAAGSVQYFFDIALTTGATS